MTMQKKQKSLVEKTLSGLLTLALVMIGIFLSILLMGCMSDPNSETARKS